jgi:hypothetical protein
MNAPVKPEYVRKNKAVYLSKDLPQGFGNRNRIVANPPRGSRRKGYVISNGFEGGVLRVKFSLAEGDETVQFNELSAGNYLVCDPWL